MRIGFFGCGFLASWIVHPVVKMFNPSFILLVDMERFEDENIDNTLFLKSHVGLFKTHALKMLLIQTTRIPPQSITVFNKKVDEKLFFKLYRDFRLNVAVVTFDDPELRNKIARESVSTGVNTLFVGVTNNLDCAVIWSEHWNRCAMPALSRTEAENIRVCERRDMVAPAFLASYLVVEALKNFLEGRKISYLSSGLEVFSIV